MTPITQYAQIRVGMEVENSSRGKCTITNISAEGWIRFTYIGLEGPDFVNQRIYENADKLFDDDDPDRPGVISYNFYFLEASK